MTIGIGEILLGLLALVALVQIVYYLLCFLRVALYNDKLDGINNKPFSIIICARNEGRHLENNLSAWLNQEYKDAYGNTNYEVLLVDHMSDDGSNYLYKEYLESYPHFRTLQLKQEAKGIPGKKFPLSMGIKEAKYENLLLTDADCTPNSNLWLQQVAKSYSADTEVVLGYGPYKKESGFLNIWQRWETLHTALMYFGFALNGKPYMGVGRNLSYVRKIFNENKGFSKHHHIASGDDDLFINQVANKRNTKILLHKDSYTYSEAKKSFDAWWFQKSRHLGTSKFYKPLHKNLLGLYSAAHTMFWLLLLPTILLASKYFLIIIGIFLVRLLVQWITIGLGARRLHENDLILWVPLFDILTLYYNIKLLPSVFKSADKWK
jgi:cellulose synthase/poly-beta-1,6-N-acetylglucosamine synthase-like glycosyltransferase